MLLLYSRTNADGIATAIAERTPFWLVYFVSHAAIPHLWQRALCTSLAEGHSISEHTLVRLDVMRMGLGEGKEGCVRVCMCLCRLTF
jgi:hypothetical protein